MWSRYSDCEAVKDWVALSDEDKASLVDISRRVGFRQLIDDIATTLNGSGGAPNAHQLLKATLASMAGNGGGLAWGNMVSDVSTCAGGISRLIKRFAI